MTFHGLLEKNVPYCSPACAPGEISQPGSVPDGKPGLARELVRATAEAVSDQQDSTAKQEQRGIDRCRIDFRRIWRTFCLKSADTRS